MNIKVLEKNWKSEIKKATLLLLLREDEVLLAMKKRGFGEGKWNGTGGKVNDGETVKKAAIRECREEINVIPKNLEEVSILNFYFPDTQLGIKVHVYLTRQWSGEPTETEEMKPKWFKLSEVPYSEMWEDDKIWMPEIFAGKKVKGSFVFEKGDKLKEYSLSQKD